MSHIVLLGDSIFDNARYVRPGPDVVAQLRESLPAGWTATLLAVDGAISAQIPDQLQGLPKDATHLLLSVGGNDALTRADILHTEVKLSSEVFLLLAKTLAAFEKSYRLAVDACLSHNLPLTVCAIYNANMSHDAEFQTIVKVGVAAYNDVIVRVAVEKNLQVIDLRYVCDKPEDYANPIEPSTVGGAKIAAAILRAVSHAPTSTKGAWVFGPA
jgi:hypothetical protein